MRARPPPPWRPERSLPLAAIRLDDRVDALCELHLPLALVLHARRRRTPSDAVEAEHRAPAAHVANRRLPDGEPVSLEAALQVAQRYERGVHRALRERLRADDALQEVEAGLLGGLVLRRRCA